MSATEHNGKNGESMPERENACYSATRRHDKSLYTPEDIRDLDYENDVARPGEFPFTRGLHQTMYRGRLWTMRQFAGFGAPEHTNERFKYLLEHGQTGLSVAFDVPTLMGLDSDHPLAAGEVGRCGVAVDTVRDMEKVFDGIPLEKVSTSMTINAPAAVMLAFYQVVAERQGADISKLRGTTQNDILKEFHAQNEFIFPPEPSVGLVTDTIEYCSREMPSWYPVSISGYHIREAGATAEQELAFTLADGLFYAEKAVERGLDVDAFAPRLSFFFDAHMDLFEEVAKFRAARRIWAREMKERFQAGNDRSCFMRFHTQTAGVSLTAQQPMNNVIRTAIEALAAVLGGTQSLHTNSLDETYALPTEDAVRIALRTQQIIAHETGVPCVIDPLGGSYYVEAMTNQMEQAARGVFRQIEDLGGMFDAIQRGYFRREIAMSAYRYQRDLEEGRRKIVGVNCYYYDKEEPVPILRIDPEVEKAQKARLEQVKSERNAAEVERALQRVSTACKDGENVMPHLVQAARAECTLGEIVEAIKKVYGEYTALLAV